jgi:hypothetical protein
MGQSQRGLHGEAATKATRDGNILCRPSDVDANIDGAIVRPLPARSAPAPRAARGLRDQATGRACPIMPRRHRRIKSCTHTPADCAEGLAFRTGLRPVWRRVWRWRKHCLTDRWRRRRDAHRLEVKRNIVVHACAKDAYATHRPRRPGTVIPRTANKALSPVDADRA